MWLEEAADKRVNVRRVEEVIEAKVDVVATACPYCLTMFEDALTTKGVEETIKAKDISELVLEAAGLK
jgi:Fe-S oxidoreductase